MKIATLIACCAAFLAAAPMYGQSSTGKKSAAEAAESKTGVRFVICSPSNEKLPSPLYYRSGKKFKKVTLSSRMPSPRIRAVGGVVEFWDEDPEADDKKDKKDIKKPAGKGKDLPKPFLSIEVPAGSSSKMLCIVVPTKTPSKPQTFFVKESAFPKQGLHVINFSSFPLRMSISEKGDFSDKKDSTIGVFKREDGICEENTWSFKGDKNGQAVSFALAFKAKGSKEFRLVRASRFVVSSKQSQINIVVKDPSRDMPKLQAVQLVDENDKED